MNTARPRALGLYVHLPWCVRKCPYCDFNSHALRGDVPETDYVTALLADLDQDLELVGAVSVVSVFIGGGTPSLFSPAAIQRLLNGIRQRLTLATDAEITLEANPGTVEQGRFAGYRAAGVNRLSLGIQSFSHRHLAALGRIHDGGQARRAVDAARAAGFDNLNLDLMYGLPGQSVTEALADLDEVLRFAPGHVSHYQLTIEPNTLFHAQPPRLPDGDAIWAMYSESRHRFAAAGYEQYEVSAWGRPGMACRHNLNYWRFGDYLGIGAGAHGKLRREGGSWRTAKRKHPPVWLREAGGPGRLAELRRLDAADLAFEFMLNRLRLTDDFSLAEFSRATGLDPAVLTVPLARARERGLLERRGEQWAVSELGWRFLNDLQVLFLPEAPVSAALKSVP